MESPEEEQASLQDNHRLIRFRSGLEVLIEADDSDQSEVMVDVGYGWIDEPPALKGVLEFMNALISMNSFTIGDYSEMRNQVVNKNRGSIEVNASAEHTMYRYKIKHSALEDLISAVAMNMSRAHQSDDRLSRAYAIYQHEQGMDHFAWRPRQKLIERYLIDDPGSKFPEAVQHESISLKYRSLKRASYHGYDYFWADNMKVFIRTPIPLDIVERLVRTTFHRMAWSNELSMPGERRPKFRQKIQFESLRRGQIALYEAAANVMKVSFYIPDYRMIRDTQPSMYYSYLLESRKEGSLYDSLWKLGLAENVAIDLQHKREAINIFNVNINLTKRGVAGRNEVLNMVLTYLKLITAQPISEDVFNAAREFNNRRLQVDTKHFKVPVETVRDDMYTFLDRRSVLTPEVATIYDSDMIQFLGTHLNSNNCVVSVCSPDYRPIPLVQGWHDFRAAVEPMPQLDLAEDYGFRFPEHNADSWKEYIFTQQPETYDPECMLETDLARVWWLSDKDEIFTTINLKIAMRSPIGGEEDWFMKTAVYARAAPIRLSQRMRRISYWSQEWYTRNGALYVTVKCLPDIALFCVKQLFDILATAEQLSDKAFTQIKEAELNRLLNIPQFIFKDPDVENFINIVSTSNLNYAEQDDILKNLNQQDIAFPYKGRVIMQLSGNISRHQVKQACELVDLITNKPDEPPMEREDGRCTSRDYVYDAEQTNGFIFNAYGDFSYEKWASMMFIQKYTDFIPRGIGQVGRIWGTLKMLPRKIGPYIWMVFMVGRVSKRPPLDEYIPIYIENSYQHTIEPMTAEQFEENKQVLKAGIEERFEELSPIEKWWKSITFHDFDTDSMQKILTAIEDLDYEFMVSHFKHNVLQTETADRRGFRFLLKQMN